MLSSDSVRPCNARLEPAQPRSGAKGFPKADLDLYQVRSDRQKVAGMRS